MSRLRLFPLTCAHHITSPRWRALPPATQAARSLMAQEKQMPPSASLVFLLCSYFYNILHRLYIAFPQEVPFMKKDPAKQDSPPAAGRASDILPFRCSAIRAERFYFIGRIFLWNEKTPEHKKLRRFNVPGPLVLIPADYSVLRLPQSCPIVAYRMSSVTQYVFRKHIWYTT